MRKEEISHFNSILVILIIAIFSQGLIAEVLYVDSINGNDANPGTREKPLSTLGKAAILVNNNSDSGPTTIKILPGIYNLTQTVVIKNSRPYTKKDRLTIEASVLPDDPGWKPLFMPIILSTENPRNPERPDIITETYGIKIKVSHVTIRGLKFLGSPVLKNMYAPIERINKGLDDLLVTQCMFIGDKDSLDIYCPVIATGHKFVVEHCIFHNCHASAVFWDGPEGISGKNNAMRYCIVDGGFISGVWTCQTADDFEFHHNIITNTEYFWMRKKSETPIRYKLNDCIINVNKFSGYGNASGPIGETGAEITYDLKNVINSAHIHLVEDKNKRDYLHVLPGTFGCKLGAGLFKKQGKVKVKMQKSQHIEEGLISVNNAQLYYKAIGQGEPIIVVHGGPGFDHIHMLPFKELASDYKVIFYDQRAIGNSTGSVDSNSITVDNFVEDLEGLRKELKLGKINILGHSWGAALAAFYSIKYPQNMKSLILLGAAASSEYLDQYFKNIQNNTIQEDSIALKQIAQSQAFKEKQVEAVQNYFHIAVKPFFHDQSLAEKLDLTFGRKTAKNQNRINQLLFEEIRNFNIHEELSVVKCPTLIVHGESDPLPIEAPRKIHEHIPQSRFVILKQAGHFMFIESPDELFLTIRNFLKDIK